MIAHPANALVPYFLRLSVAGLGAGHNGVVMTSSPASASATRDG